MIQDGMHQILEICYNMVLAMISVCSNVPQHVRCLEAPRQICLGRPGIAFAVVLLY